jgi:hypothetical protein
MTQLNQNLGFLLVANNLKEVTIIHHPHNIGGTLLCPTDKVGCLVGTGPNSTPVVLNHRSALESVQAIVPPITDIGACLKVDALAALATPATDRLVNLEGLNCFFPAPFLRNAILLADSSSPLALVLADQAAQEEHVHNHSEDKGFDRDNIDAHLETFYLWCLGVHQGQVEETCFSIAPDDGDISEWSARCHHNYIHLSLSTASAAPASAVDTTNILLSIAAGMSRSYEEAENQNKFQCKQLDYIKEKDTKKKNKAKKWHAMSRCLVFNAASTNSDFPTDNILASYLSIINSNTAGMADKELQSQMTGLSLSDAGFTHDLAASLYAGDLKWNNRTIPSNLSPFTIFKLDPLSAMQSE